MDQITAYGDTFEWATDGNTKDFLLARASPYLAGRQVRRILDVGSARSEQIVDLCPGAEEYLFLDSFALPPARTKYTLLLQSVGAPFPIADESLDVVSTNGSFDHFTHADRERAFAEIQRCLRPGGLLLFACEYFDFDPNSEAEFFDRFSSYPAMKAINCGASSNIRLRQISERLDELRIRQRDLTRLPDGRPLRDFVSRSDAKYFRPHEQEVEVEYGTFFVVFDRL